MWEINRTPAWMYQSVTDSMVVLLLLGCAVGLYRLAPGVSLSLAWMSGMVQVVTQVDVLLVQLSVALVSYGTARYGSTLVVWLGGLSIPAATLFGVGMVLYQGLSRFDLGIFSQFQGYDTGGDGLLALATMAVTILSLPWLIGLVLRLRQRAQRSREAGEAAVLRQQAAEEARALAEAQREHAVAERTHAEEMARLREDQTNLARDVHDVVGHSLAVILAQAESAQFLPDDDTARIHRTMENIATSARQSLRDVRQVLAAMADPESSGRLLPSGSPDSLLDDVRAAGGELRDEVVGVPRPLPPELGTVAFRVLQEMLTNALKHGRRGEPVLVERAWSDTELRIEVSNAVSPRPPGTAAPLAATGSGTGHGSGTGTGQGQEPAGMGLDSMRRRLGSVGGRLRVSRVAAQEPDRMDRYTATAWIPLAEAPR
jgi:signal transduction histidine kinase